MTTYDARPTTAGRSHTFLTLRRGLTVTGDDTTLTVRFQDRPVARISNGSAEVRNRFLTLARDTIAVPPASFGAGRNVAEDAGLGSEIADRLGTFFATGFGSAQAPLATIERITANGHYEPAELDNLDVLVLDKFTLMRRRGESVVLENPATAFRVAVEDPTVAAIVASTAGYGDSVEQLIARTTQPQAARELLRHLVGLAFLRVTDSPRDPHEAEVEMQWDFHDLLFHARSRSGRTDEPFGGRFPWVGIIDPRPAAPELPNYIGDVALPEPSYDEVRARDLRLVEVMESRVSTRHYGKQPLTLEQLGEFLYRVQRIRGRYGPRPEAGMPYEGATRPYPTGGAAYEIELYMNIQRCEGIEPGGYFYDPMAHRLLRLDVDEAHLKAIAAVAKQSTGGIANGDIIFSLVSRIQRLSWKYQSIAYSVTLKHAGVLYATMYNVATAMGIAACGLGSGDSDLISVAYDLPYLEMLGVGDFIIGSMPTNTPIGEAAAVRPDYRSQLGSDWYQRARAGGRS